MSLRVALLRDPAPLLLLLLPFALLALDSSWIYSLPMRDPWIYYGYFHNAAQYADEFPDRYFSSRLSVILPGFLVHRALDLPPLAANLILRLALFWTAVLSFYGVCRMTLGPRAALLAAVALGSHPFFLLAVGTNYVDGFGIAYFLLALLVLTLAARAAASWRLCLVVAGAAATAMVTANLFYVVYLPLLAGWFLAVRRGSRQPPLPAAFGLATAGAATLFLVFSAINRLFGGPFFYLIASVRFTTSAVQKPNPFLHPVETWLGGAGWLVLPAVVGLAAAPSLWWAWRVRGGAERAKRRLLVSAQLLFLGFLALLVLLHAGADRAALEYFYYASVLIPVAFLALAAQIEPLVGDLSPRSFARLTAAAALTLVASWALSFDAERLAALPGPPVLLPLVVGLGIAVAAAIGARRSFGAALAIVLCLAVSQWLSRSVTSAFHQFSRHYGGDARGHFLQVDRGFKLLQQADPTHQLRLWYDMYDGSAGRLYDTVVSTFLLCPRMVGGDFPRLASNGMMCDGTLLTPGTRLAVLSARPDAAAQAQASLRGIGFAGRVTARHEIGGPVHGFAVTFLEVAPAEAP